MVVPDLFRVCAGTIRGLLSDRYPDHVSRYAVQPDLTDRELFDTAAEHFAERDFDEDVLDDIWRRLERQALTSVQLAQELDDEVGDLDAFLEWTAEQDLIASGRIGEDIYYSRYDLELDRLANRVDGTSNSLREFLSNLEMDFLDVIKVTAAVSLPLGGLLAYVSLQIWPMHPLESSDVRIFSVMTGTVGIAMLAVVVVVLFGPSLLDALGDKLTQTSDKKHSE
jgi:hypothetical protein